MKLTIDHVRYWVGSDHLTIDHLLTLLADALNDQAEARMMREDCMDYAKQCEDSV